VIAADVLPLRAQAELELRRRRASRTQARVGLLDYCRRVTPTWDWEAAHIGLFASYLDRLRRREITRLAVELPIRHSKSETGTVRFPAQWITEEPATRVLIGSHSALLAQKFSRQARRLVRAAGVGISAEKDTAAEWETAAGGGLRAVGAGAGSAGMGADVVIIDDPFGSRGDAESEAGREAVWDWVTNDMLSRLEPNGVAVVTHSRWHSDDVIGRIRSGQLGDGWVILTLPAEAYDDGTPDPLGRAPGEALWPARWPREALNQRRTELGEYAYASLYQQRPQPRSGGMFPWAKWVELDAVPVIPSRVVRYWDLAGTEPRGAAHDPDYTVGALEGVMSDQRIAILDVARFRVASAERLARMVQVAQADRAKYGSRVTWWIERPTGMTGEEQKQALSRALMHTGIAVQFEPASGDKTLRAEPLSAAQGAGNVCLAPGDWRDAFRTEAADFPRGKHDDQVDAAVGAFAKLTLAPVSGAVTGTFSR
jgi:predicted phage terminase large subunit-like protein